MTICAACQELQGKLKNVPPHPALQLKEAVKQSRSTMGNVKGQAITYRCADCKSLLQLDTDRSDDFAGWGLLKEGK